MAATKTNGTTSVQERSWPLALKIAYVVAADGTAAQTTTVKQTDEETQLETIGPLPIGFATRSNVVSTSDTLQFDGSGALTGLTGRAATQDYFSADSDGSCFSRSIAAASGKVTSISDGKSCF